MLYLILKEASIDDFLIFVNTDTHTDSKLGWQSFLLRGQTYCQHPPGLAVSQTFGRDRVLSKAQLLLQLKAILNLIGALLYCQLVIAIILEVKGEQLRSVGLKTTEPCVGCVFSHQYCLV